MSDHPDVVPAFRKELHFFDVHYDEGLPWYRANLPMIASLRKGRITGEATPNYLIHPYIPRRVQSAVPEVKLLVLLRNPIDRTHSAWRHKRKWGKEELSFADALAADEQRVAADLEELQGREEFRPRSYMRYSYLGKSRYAEHLEGWLEIFDRAQFLICRSEDLFAGNEEALRSIYRFLGLQDRSRQPFPRVNSTEEASMDADVRLQLADYFRPHNRRLYDLVGRDFEWA